MRALCPRRRTSAPKPLVRDKICTGTAAHSVVCSCCQLRPLVLTWKASSVRIPVVAGSRSRLRPTDERCRANQRRARAGPPRAHFTSKYTRKGERRRRLRARALVLIDKKPSAARASVGRQTGCAASMPSINDGTGTPTCGFRFRFRVLVYHPDGKKTSPRLAPQCDRARVDAIEMPFDVLISAVLFLFSGPSSSLPFSRGAALCFVGAAGARPVLGSRICGCAARQIAPHARNPQMESSWIPFAWDEGCGSFGARRILRARERSERFAPPRAGGPPQSPT